MALWRYSAVEIAPSPSGTGPAALRRGELAAETAADVRASLRNIGLRVIEVRPARRQFDLFKQIRIDHIVSGYLRQRRSVHKAELFDALATLISAGLPLVEAVEAMSSGDGKSKPMRRLLVSLREDLRSGTSFAEAMESQSAWFDDVESALVRAGQHSGELEPVLRAVVERQEKQNALVSKLVAVLAYPTIVACIGIGVAIFLSVKTLPQLAAILTDASVEVPTLTRWVMAFGEFTLNYGLIVLVGLVLLSAVIPTLQRRLTQRYPSLERVAGRMIPEVSRKITLASWCRDLVLLLRSGVPMVEAFNVLRPTLRGPGSRKLSLVLESAAAAVERGQTVAQALDDPRWFGAEVRRLIQLGESSGELDSVLEKLAARFERQSSALIQRLSSLLEPAVIVALAAFIGIIVMSAVLPIVRLQEVV